MKGKIGLAVVACIFLACGSGRADFKYIQTSQITGGAMAGMMKGLGVFSKSARQAAGPMQSVTYIKGGRLRTDQADGSYQIIDLDGRRIIHVDPHKSAYSITTFEQMREAVEKMSQQMDQAMKKQASENNANVTITPKIEVNPTGRSQAFLGQNAQEVNIKIELLMQSADATHGTQSGSMNTSIDSWVAPSVSGYQEVTDFYKKMATEIGWTPGGIGMDSRVARSMVELYKGGKIPQGLPMMQVISLGAAGQAPPQQGQNAAPAQQPAQSSGSSQEPATPREAAAKALGGMFGGFGGFGHKKKKQQEQQPPDQQDQQNQQQAQSASAPSPNASASLIEITTRVTSYSTDPVDASLFDIPSGYTQVQSDTQKMVEQGR
ncbi:MAG: hypothetical protein ACRD2G_15550 [Terriglobia bacterium]